MSEKIKALSEKDKVRRKISVWLGSSNHNAVLHCVRELVGNAADEILKNKGNKIIITRHNEKTIIVEDNCKGLPLEGVNEEGIENWKLLFTTLFAGSKYENGIENNDYSVGSNGLFISVLTFSSREVQYEIARPDGNIYSIKFEKGELVDELKVIGKSENTYTKITYTLDDEVFEGNQYSYEELCQLGDEQASLINGEIIVIDVPSEQTITYKHENGIRDYLEKNTTEGIHNYASFQKDVSFEVIQKYEDKELVNGEWVAIEKEIRKIDDIKIDLAFKYTKSDEDIHQVEFLNGSNLINHGTIYDGFVKGIRNGINKKIKSLNLYQKNEKQITKEDILVGLNYVISFKSYFPVFESQTKFASHVTYFEEVMQKTIEDHLEVYFTENTLDAQKIIDKILITKRSRESAEKTRLSIKSKLQSETKSGLRKKIENLNDCDMKKSELENRELWLCEGLSAASTISEARDSTHMGTYALSGRFIASLKNSVEDVLNNKPAMGIIQALGCGIEIPKNEFKKFKDIDTFDIDNLRYGKIIIACDQDFIGFGIGLSLISFFYKYMPTLLKQNRISISMSPRYEIRHKDELIFAYTENEKDKITQKLIDESKKFTVGIVKGLGELDKDIYWEYVMNPENRILKQLIYNEQYDNDIEYYFNTLIGEDIVERKKFVKENITNLNTDLID